LLKLKAKEYFEQLRNPLGSNEWSGVYPTSFNAFYVKSYNKIRKYLFTNFNFDM